MDDICRLCCSAKFVNNYIFDEENALYIKMSLYLPIKVFKNDRLPQKVCDKCSCKVNDFYQFCNEAIEVQNRLRSMLLSSTITANESIDLSLIKENVHSPPPLTISTSQEQSTQTEHNVTNISVSTDNNVMVKIKEEPKAPSPPTVKIEDECADSDNYVSNDILSDNSEDLSLVNLKKKKKRHKKEKLEMTNGEVNDNKRGKKRKQKFKEWEMLTSALPEGIALTVVDKTEDSNNKVTLDVVKQEVEVTVVKPQELSVELKYMQKKVKHEPDEVDIYHCCICFTQCYSRSDMLQHYRRHASDAEAPPAPPPPPPPPPPAPAADTLKCTRCQKVVAAGAWAAHWQRHCERDRRPYHCALCEKTFRNHHQILKHGLTHKEGATAPQSLTKRFICDLCPEGFVYMRYLLAHRSRAHPEARARALALRCAQCGRQFAHLNSLRRHLRAHSGERNYLCSVCGKALSSREHLKFHVRIHTGYKPNVCKTCGKGFAKKCNLTLHERVHSGEKPHVCSHCGKAFSQRSTLVIHERYHSGARPYVCAVCGRGFVAKGLLSMHLKTTCK